VSGDDLRKVRTGEPLRIPARTYNRFIDAARAQQEGRRLFGPGQPGAAELLGIAPACNASDEDAPMHAVVELAPRSQTQGQIEFVRPGGEGGTGLYAATAEPIPAGAIGRIALSAGPHTVLVAEGESPSCGDLLGPVAGEWTASTTGNPQVWACVGGDPGDGLAAVIFVSGTGTVMVRALESMTSDDTPYPVRLLRVDGWLSGASFEVYRPCGIVVPADETGFLGVSADGHPVFVPSHARLNNNVGLTIEVTGTSFDPDTLGVGRIWLRGPD